MDPGKSPPLDVFAFGFLAAVIVFMRVAMNGI